MPRLADLVRPPDGGRGGPEEVVALLRPQEIAGGPGLDRRPERAHRLADIEREHDAGRLGAAEHPGLRDDGIRLELPDRLGELPVVARGGHDPRASAPIEEVHDLLGHLRRPERQNHPRHLIHRLLPRQEREVCETVARATDRRIRYTCRRE